MKSIELATANALPPDALQAIRSRLNRGERVLWEGRPSPGLRLQTTDLYAIPFSIMWCGFAIFWEGMVLTRGGPWFFGLWGIPFVCVGLYMVVGRFFYDAYVRERTIYAVTNQRVLILRNNGQGNTQSMLLTGLSQIDLHERPDGSGTIRFDGYAASFFQRFPAGPPRGRPSLDFVLNARHVHDVIQTAQVDLVSHPPGTF
jgi:hypothetical protein